MRPNLFLVIMIFISLLFSPNVASVSSAKDMYEVATSDLRLVSVQQPATPQFAPIHGMFPMPVYLAQANEDIIKVYSDMSFAIYVDPTNEINEDYDYDGLASEVFAYRHSEPNVMFFIQVNAATGKTLTLHFANGGKSTLEFIGSINTIADPVERLKIQWGPLFYIVEEPGETITVSPTANFIVYISQNVFGDVQEVDVRDRRVGVSIYPMLPPDPSDIRSTPNVFRGEISTYYEGDKVIVDFGPDRFFYLEFGTVEGGQSLSQSIQNTTTGTNSYDSGYADGRASCQNDPADCGITVQELGGYTKAEYEKAIENARREQRLFCSQKPADCGLAIADDVDVKLRFTPECKPGEPILNEDMLSILLPAKQTYRGNTDFGQTHILLIDAINSQADVVNYIDTAEMNYPTVDPSGLLLAYVADRVLYIRSGGSVRALTELPIADTSIAWSPDGQQIAFSAYPVPFSDNSYDDAEIYVVDMSGKELFRITDNETDDFDPTWSPTGEELLFASKIFVGRDSITQIFVATLAGDEPQPLTDKTIDAIDPSWSPTGTQIAFIDAKPRKVVFNNERLFYDQLYVIKKDGTGLQQLTFNEFHSAAPSWSPDGQQIAFVSHPPLNSNLSAALYVIHANGDCQTQLINEQFDYTLKPIWSPTDDRIAVIATPLSFSGTHPEWVSKLYLVNADGSGFIERYVAQPNEIFSDPQWSLVFGVN